MDEEEHEVYGGEIPEMEADVDLHHADVDMSTAVDDDAVKVLLINPNFYNCVFLRVIVCISVCNCAYMCIGFG